MRLLIGALLLALFAEPAGAATLLRCGRLIDVRAGRVLTNTTSVVDEARRAVRQRYKDGADKRPSPR